jgi:hypothetical protein
MHHSILMSFSLLIIVLLIPQFESTKLGECPPYNHTLIQSMVCANLCKGDESCPGTQKCVINLSKIILSRYSFYFIIFFKVCRSKWMYIFMQRTISKETMS